MDHVRVLVVDDDVDVASMTADGLQMYGFDVRYATDDIEALKLAVTFQPQVAVLDIRLARTSGHDLAREITALPGLMAVKLIAVTGWTAKADEAFAAGFHAHVTKPATLAGLVELITQLARTR